MKHKNRIPISPLLKKMKFYFDLLKRATDDYLLVIDPQENMAMVSPSLIADFDLPCEVLHDFHGLWAPLVHPDERSFYLANMRNISQQSHAGGVSLEFRVKTRKGEYVWLSCQARIGLDSSGRPLLIACVMKRMAQRNQADEVTGLLNKYQFERGIKLALAAYRQAGAGGAIMVFGLDNFKIINETHNRAIGDQILKHVAHLAANILPPEITLYKLDGDQFGIILPEAAESDVAELFSGLQKCFARPHTVYGHTFFCTISAGTVFYPQGGKEYLALHKHAEAAMDIAKRGGKNQNCIFSREEYNRWVRSISMRDSLWSSVESGCEGFSLFFQPQVKASSKKLFGAEALLRWHNPEGRMVSPMEFIPILEQTKMIIPVGKWVFEEAVRIAKKWQHICPGFQVSVNMSYEQVKDPSFHDFVNDCLERYAISPATIVLELTESSIVADWHFVNRQFDAYRERGIRIAMDDFGTGYSSLASLKNLSCDIVKIDREFVKHILENEFDRKLVEYAVSLCHSIGMVACIEGVEERAEYELLVEQCKADSIQGYLFGRPESVPDFEEKFLRGNMNEVI